MNEEYDVVVIGAGTGGYPAAIRAAQLGMTVACIDTRPTLGGTCLNVGCIPSKALLYSSELLAEAQGAFAEHGIVTGDVTVDLATMLARKDKVVGDLTRGIEYLFKKNKVEWLRGWARFDSPTRVRVAHSDTGDERVIDASKGVIIATGSEAISLPGVAIDEERIVSSTGALSLSKVPERFVVVGGGYIGLELGSVWQRLGAKVTVVEFLDRIVPGMDAEIAAQLRRMLERQGLTFHLGTKVVSAEAGPSGARLCVEPVGGGQQTILSADAVLMAIGRRPFTTGLGLDVLGIELDDKGRIPVGKGFETSAPGVFAVGDVIAGPMLAHKSTLDGVTCAEALAGRYYDVDYSRVAGVIYTSPEVATVGRTEDELKAKGVAYKRGVFPFTASSRARCNGDTRGMVKVLVDTRSDTILGVHIIGPDAGTMISEAVLAMEFGGTSEDIALTVHPHPTLPEAIREAALAAQGQPMHV